MDQIADIQSLLGADWQRYESSFRGAVVPSADPLMEQIWTYVSAKRGKQIRPMLVLLSAAVSRNITDKTITTAVAMEMLHTASLIHDDVVDHSPMRRGQAAVQEVWTNKIAILAGDYMLSRVIEQIAHLRNQHILGIVANMGKQLSEGELIQLHQDRSMWISREQYYEIIRRKTAVLFAACAEAGAESAGGTSHVQTLLRQFGTELGLAFQIVDDMLDYSTPWGDDDPLGKERMQDIRDGKVTLPLIIAAERAGQHPAADASVDEIRDFVIRYDGIGGARHEMERHEKSALEALQQVGHNSLYRQALENLVELCCHRIA